MKNYNNYLSGLSKLETAFKNTQWCIKLPSNLSLINEEKAIDNVCSAYHYLSNSTFTLSEGWVFSTDVPIPKLYKLVTLLKLTKNKVYKNQAGDECSKIALELADYTKSKIANKIRLLFPNRYTYIKEALKAHDMNMYTLSIPAFIIQIDGVINDFFNNSPFHGNKLLKKLSKFKHRTDRLSLTLFSYFKNVLCELKKGNILNRHELLHGSNHKCFDFKHSLKTILVLNFVLDIIEHNQQAIVIS